MRRKYLKSASCLFIISVGLWAFAFSALAGQVVLVGEVNDNQELVADGQIYTIGDSPAGDDLVRNYISQKVRVVGKMVATEDGNIIVVESFEVVEE